MDENKKSIIPDCDPVYAFYAIVTTGTLGVSLPEITNKKTALTEAITIISTCLILMLITKWIISKIKTNINTEDEDIEEYKSDPRAITLVIANPLCDPIYVIFTQIAIIFTFPHLTHINDLNDAFRYLILPSMLTGILMNITRSFVNTIDTCINNDNPPS